MLFVDLDFLLFLAAVLGVYWNLRSNELRKWFLLGASYFFYGSWDWRFVIMLAALSLGDFLFALRIEASRDDSIRKRYVIASLAMNLGVLAYFKYCNFFLSSAVALAGALGLHIDEPSLHIVLPVGISFFTFQSLSYTIDVYRREIAATRHLRDYLLFAAFFPQLVAGPIVRPRVFLPQLDALRSVDVQSVKAALVLFLMGFLKKTAIADNVSPYVDAVFQSPADYSNLAALTAVWLYAAQIYCDFSGYSDMAIAVAGLMGYRLTLNFDAPYLAGSLQAFWRRWHISLSTWIRDYIYVSLGGRSQSRRITYRNLLVTMLAGGLWHGAAWTFVAWGGLHGLGLVIQQEFRHRFGTPERPLGAIRRLLAWFLTLQFVCACWILFRATTFPAALEVLARCFLLLPDGKQELPVGLTVLPLLLLAVQFVLNRSPALLVATRARWPGYAAGMGASAALAVALLPLGHRPFIYFQF
jgi:alginate O-acetyltransferase complex protein AlgI